MDTIFPRWNTCTVASGCLLSALLLSGCKRPPEVPVDPRIADDPALVTSEVSEADQANQQAAWHQKKRQANAPPVHEPERETALEQE